MATISRLKPGQVVYSLKRQLMGNTQISIRACFPVTIIEIDPAGQWVLASWNGNRPQKYREHHVKGWKVRKPEPKSTRFGMASY